MNLVPFAGLLLCSQMCRRSSNRSGTLQQRIEEALRETPTGSKAATPAMSASVTPSRSAVQAAAVAALQEAVATSFQPHT